MELICSHCDQFEHKDLGKIPWNNWPLKYVDKNLYFFYRNQMAEEGVPACDTISHHVIPTERAGALNVWVQGDLGNFFMNNQFLGQ